MKRTLAAALSLALLVSLAACGGKDRFDAGKVEEGVCYQLTDIAPDAVAMRVDGIDVPMDMYFYNLCYAASYMESYMNMYGMDLDWSMELQEGETVLDVTKDSILEKTAQGSLDVYDAKMNPVKNYVLPAKQFDKAMKQLNRFFK